MADVALCLDPLTRLVSTLHPANRRGVSTLQGLCNDVIRRAVTVRRFSRMSSLPLPNLLLRQLHGLYLDNFCISADNVTEQHHHDNTYSAKCLVDGTNVMLQICPQGLPLPPDPTLLTSFTYLDSACHVYEPTESLYDVISVAKESECHLEESRVWRVLHQVARIVSMLPVGLRITPRLFHIFNGDVVYKPSLGSHDVYGAQIVTDVAFYEAPEVFLQAPSSVYSQSWSIGCLLYELMVLEPAFYDRTESGNMMDVMIGVVEGVMPPPPPPGLYSAELGVVLAGCLQRDTTKRPKPNQVADLALSKLTEQ